MRNETDLAKSFQIIMKRLVWFLVLAVVLPRSIPTEAIRDTSMR